MRRIISTFLVLLTTFYFIAPAWAQKSSRNFQLPAELGTVQESSLLNHTNTASTFPLIIHIQDAHANPDAQESIRKILHWLKESQPGRRLWIALEGAKGVIHPEYFNFFKDFPEANQAMVQDLAAKGEITGAELFAWDEYLSKKQESSRLLGIEDAGLYRAHLGLYQETVHRRPEIEKALQPFKAVLDAAASQILSRDLRNFFKEREQGRGPEYMKYLAAEAGKKLAIDLADPVEEMRFPQFARLLAADRFSKAFPAEIQADALLKEMELLEAALIQKMAVRESERRLAALIQRFILWESFLNLELTRDAYHEMKKEGILSIENFFESFAEFKKGDLAAPVRALEPYWDTAHQFYNLAGLREQALFKNIVTQVLPQMAAAHHKTDVMVLMTGGFHTQGLVRLMRNRKADYVVIQPKIHSSDPVIHEKVFSGRNADVEKLIGPSRLNKQEALFLKTILEVGVPWLRQNLGMDRLQMNQTISHALQDHPILSRMNAVWLKNFPGAHAVPEILLTNESYKDLLPQIPPRRSEMRMMIHGEMDTSHVGIFGVTGALTTVATVGKDHVITAVDYDDNFRRAYALLREPIFDLQAKKISGRYVQETHSPEVMDDLVRSRQIIYIDYPLPENSNYEDYQKRLFGMADDLGQALKKVRGSGDPRPRIFILRAMAGVDTTEDFYNKVKWQMGSADPEYLNFEVVYQPDLSFREEKIFVEPYVIFGLRDELLRPENQASRASVEGFLSSIYRSGSLAKKPDFMNVRSAEQAKDIVIINLAAKLGLFGNLANLSERYGADLSVIALGAGLDWRIQKLTANLGMGFGGRLLTILRWIREQRISQFVDKIYNEENQEESKTNIERHVKDSLDAALGSFLSTEPGKHKSIPEIFKSLRPEYHTLFYIKLILRTNKENQNQFLKRMDHVLKEQGETFRGTTISLLGVSYGRGTSQVTEPVTRIVRWLIKEQKVHEIIVSDPHAEETFREWIRSQADLSPFPVQYSPSLTEAVKKSDYVLIPTDSNEQLSQIPPEEFIAAVRENPRRIVFDAANIWGLQANGKRNGELSVFHDLNYVAVGRAASGPLFQAQSQYQLADSALFGPGEYDKYLQNPWHPEEIAVIGARYVGLTTAANLAHLGHRVSVVDINEKIIADLNSPQIQLPVYEPGLHELIQRSTADSEGRRLFFTTSHQEAVSRSKIVYLAVDTKAQESGEIDLASILKAASQIAEIIAGLKQNQQQAGNADSSAWQKTLVIKSTVTPNAFEEIEKIFSAKGLRVGKDYGLVSNPEFLKEGSAVQDVMFPDRTVIGIYGKIQGGDRARIVQQMLNLWYPIRTARADQSFLLTDTASATLIKYLSNSYLAQSISATNLQAWDSTGRGLDFLEARRAELNDSRLGPFGFFAPGCGYGGSCFPKDVRALAFLSERVTRSAIWMIQFADEANFYFQDMVADEVVKKAGRFAGEEKTAGVLGLTFKEKSGDMRKTPAARIIYQLLRHGLSVRAHDPILNIAPPEAPPRQESENDFLKELYSLFMQEGKLTRSASSYDDFFDFPSFRKYFQTHYVDTKRFIFTNTPQEALKIEDGKPVDAIGLFTAWPEYAALDYSTLIPTGRSVPMIDARNLYRNRFADLTRAGVRYYGLGRSPEVLNLARSELRLVTTAQFKKTFAAARPEAPAPDPVRDLLSQYLQKDLAAFVAKSTDTPIHPVMVYDAAKINKLPVELVPLLAVLSAGEAEDLLTLQMNVSPKAAQKLETAFKNEMREVYHLPAKALEIFSVQGIKGRNLLQSTKRSAHDNQSRSVGILPVMADSRTAFAFLEKIGLIRRPHLEENGQKLYVDRLWGEDLEISTAMMLAVLALRHPVPEQTEIRKIASLAGQYPGIAAALEKAVQALRLIAAKA